MARQRSGDWVAFAAFLGLAAVLPAAPGCRSATAPDPDAPAAAGAPESSAEEIESRRVLRSNREWRRLLDARAFRVTRLRKTERAGSGAYLDEERPGTYRCVCCELALFGAEAKYDAHSGWPSFEAPLDSAHVHELEDRRGGVSRTEVRCARCDAHVGHVFEGGPGPENLRYCVNSAALTFDVDEGAGRPPLDVRPRSEPGRAVFALG